MKFNIEQYKKECVTSIMLNHVHKQKLRNVRPIKLGIYYEVFDGGRWLKKKLPQHKIDELLDDLAA